jgi:hypothetical protein
VKGIVFKECKAKFWHLGGVEVQIHSFLTWPVVKFTLQQDSLGKNFWFPLNGKVGKV